MPHHSRSDLTATLAPITPGLTTAAAAIHHSHADQAAFKCAAARRQRIEEMHAIAAPPFQASGRTPQ